MHTFFNFTESDYRQIFETIVRRVSRCGSFSGTITTFLGEVECRLRCVLTVGSATSGDEQYGDRLKIESLCSTMTTLIGGDSVANDFSFDDMIYYAA